MIGISALPWLVRAPSDLRARCRAFDAASDRNELTRLCGYHLGSGEAASLSRTLRRAMTEGLMPDYFRHAKMTVLPAGTWHLAIDQTVCAAARAGIALLLDVAASDQIEQMLARK